MSHASDTVFSPSFGNRPASLVGRSAIVSGFADGLATRPGSRERATVIVGQRGYGKTVLLWELADVAREKGFAVANPTSVREGLVRRVAEKLEDDAGNRAASGKAKIAGASLGALGFSAGIELHRPDKAGESDEARLARACRELTRRGVGSLILVDELQANSREVRNLVGTYQELVGEGLDVAIALAGLPASVSSVLNDRVLTFLNRARKVQLDPLPMGEVDAFMSRAFVECGVEIGPDLRKRAVQATMGSPYLMQLVGHYVVLYAGDGGHLGADQVNAAISTAQEEYRNDVCATTLAPLSNADIGYLSAMAKLGSPCGSGAVADEMGVSADYAQQYRKRLLEGGVISAPRHGVVEFAVPLLEDYLAERMTGEAGSGSDFAMQVEP